MPARQDAFKDKPRQVQLVEEANALGRLAEECWLNNEYKSAERQR